MDIDGKPLTKQTFLDFWKRQPSTYSVKEFCGPFHPKVVDELIKSNGRCPECGRKARKHK